jgi:hypothetical protein
MSTRRRGDRHNRERRQEEAIERQFAREGRSASEQLEIIYSRGAHEFCREAVRLADQALREVDE